MNSLGEASVEMIKEIGNIGAGHIMMSISQTTHVDTKIDITRVYDLDGSQLSQIVPYLKDPVYALDFIFESSISGGFLLVFPKKLDEKVLITLRSASASALANLVTSYARSMEDYIGIKCNISLRKRYEDIESVMLSEVFAPCLGTQKKMLLIDTRYSVGSSFMTGHTFLYFNPENYENIIKAALRQNTAFAGTDFQRSGFSLQFSPAEKLYNPTRRW